MTTLRIATRRSPLALRQAEAVAAALQARHPDLSTELVKLKTQGDKILDVPLSKVGGKGLFVKELEQGLLEGRADIAVHSMKDVPADTDFPAGLHLPVILEREDPCDAFISNRYTSFAALPPDARVGTSSLRRRAQVRAAMPQAEIDMLRGNVGTRLGKLDDGQFDAIVLASAGLKRLALGGRITERLAPEQMLPAIGQGALGIECREADAEVNELVASLHESDTDDCVRAERAFNQRLAGGCLVPVAGYAILTGDELWLRGLVGHPDSGEVVAGERRGPRGEARAMGAALAEELLGRGADRILAAVGVEVE